MKKIAVAALLTALLGAVHADDYPNRAVKVIVPLAAGGPSDAVARLFAKEASEHWKQPVVVENRAGAAGMIGSMAVARSKADGYTLLFGVPSLTAFKVLIKNPEVDTERDLAAISQVLKAPYAIAVNSSLPVNSLQELIAYAKANPGKLNYGALAGGQTLAVELFKKLTGTNIVRVTYSGSAPSITALAANDIQVGFDSLFTLTPHLASGKVKALAVTTSVRAPAWPKIPTVGEAGVSGYDVSFWFGVLGPAGTPNEVQAKVAQEVASFVKKPDTVAMFDRFGYIPVGSTPEQFTRLISHEIAQWSEVSKYANVEPQ
jgi:tripartite-type tricarboxylate transporter receptor subunit TctC